MVGKDRAVRSEFMASGGIAVKKVCVIGAGTMGGGIAAHLANLGFEVSLLDRDRESAAKGFDRANNAKPPHFLTGNVATSVTVSGLRDGYAYLRDADWVCEAIFENLEAKQALYTEIVGILKPGAILTTNTSGLEIGILGAGLPADLKRTFVGTHFFNPPRYLKLLELIPTADTDPIALAQISDFLEDKVGRRVVPAKDTPGFIANRFGMWSMFHAIHCTERLSLSVEQVDAITGPFLGRPRSASFRLNDLVGLDVMADIAKNLLARCSNDPQIKFLGLPSSLAFLLEKGWIGEKVRQGYYRREGEQFLTFDLTTRAYRERQEANLPTLNELAKLPLGQRIAKALDQRDEVGEYLRLHLVPTLQYAYSIREEISHNVDDFDRVMRWGFGWEMGPFEMIDAIGHEKLGIPGRAFYDSGTVLGFDGAFYSPKPEPQFRPISSYPVIGEGEDYRIRDLGDGISALCLTTKMGVVSPSTVSSLTSVLDAGLDRFVLTSEARSYSAGFDLNFFLSAIYDEEWEAIDGALRALQQLGEKLETRTAVAAVFGHCLGGGMELALSCARIVANLETQIGLPESRVGLIPGGRGATLMRLYNQGSAKRLAEVAITLTQGTVARNAEQARQIGYLRATDITSYHPDRLIHDAKEAILQTSPEPRPRWAPAVGPLVGMIDRAQAELRSQNKLSDHDCVVGDKLKLVMAKTQFYEESLERERSEFLDLCTRALSVARIKHMLETGKPLHN